MMGVEHFPAQQQARKQLTLYVNQAELILKFITLQDVTGQFGNLWSQMAVRIHCKPHAMVD